MASKVSKKGVVKNYLESVTNIGDPTGIAKDVGKSLVNDLALDGGKDFLSYLGLDLSTGDNKNSDKHAEQTPKDDANGSVDIVNFKTKSLEKKAQKTEARIEAAIDYHRDIVRSSERFSRIETQTIHSKLEQIKTELVSLAKSTKTLQLEVASVTVESTPEKAGIYHTQFFEWMLNMLKAARERVETSEAWMSAAKNKAGKKGYWNMFKKHGTSFAMSNERGVATQVG